MSLCVSDAGCGALSLNRATGGVSVCMQPSRPGNVGAPRFADGRPSQRETACSPGACGEEQPAGEARAKRLERRIYIGIAPTLLLLGAITLTIVSSKRGTGGSGPRLTPVAAAPQPSSPPQTGPASSGARAVLRGLGDLPCGPLASEGGRCDNRPVAGASRTYGRGLVNGVVLGHRRRDLGLVGRWITQTPEDTTQRRARLPRLAFLPSRPRS